MSINTAEIPQIAGDLDAVDAAGKSLVSAGREFAATGSDVHATWQGLSGVYRAPESGELLAATAPVASDSSLIGSDVGSVGSALSAYAAEVKPLQAELERLQVEAVSFNASIAGDDEWTEDEDKVNEKNNLLKSVNAAVAAWQAAERTCASAINATYGGVQYRADDGDGTHSPDEYGYTAEMLDGATAGEEGVPWGQASEVDKPWYEDAWDSVVSFGEGLVVDGLWGAVRGLGTMVGVDGWDAMKTAWAGVGKLALALNPVTLAIDQTVGLPGMEKGEAGATAAAAGKALIAYDMWGEDPARAAGAVTGNVIGAVIGTKGAGAAVKGSGTVARAGAAASRTFPRASELAANIGGKVSGVRVNVATSMAKLELPRFGPQPALAGAGGRGSSVFEMTPGTRGRASAPGVAARIDDNTAVAGRGSSTSADTPLEARGGSGKQLTDDAPTPHEPGSGADSPQDVDGGTTPVQGGDAGGPPVGPAGGTGGPGRQPFSPYAGHRMENQARGQVGEDLSEAQFRLDGDTVTGRQVRLYESESTSRYAKADFLLRRPDEGLPDSAHIVESKTGTAELSSNQKAVYPQLEGGGPKVGSTNLDPELTKGTVLKPGDIKSAYVERWNIDDLPTSVRESFRSPGRVAEVLNGKFGPQAQQELLEWMSKTGSRTVEPIHPNPPAVPDSGRNLP